MIRPALLVLACGFMAACVGHGIRAAFGLFNESIIIDTGWTLTALSFAFALQNLMWGALQPLAGGLADRFGAHRVAFVGGLAYAGGLCLMYLSAWLPFFVGATLFVGMGQAALGFSVILGAVGRAAPPQQRSLFLGIATAGGSFGQFVFGLLGSGLYSSVSWQTAMLAFAACALIGSLCALGLKERTTVDDDAVTPLPSTKALLQMAFGDRSFVLLTAAFFVCGFQLAFIIIHLPRFLQLSGHASLAGTAIALIGLCNVVGAIVAGWSGQRFQPKFPLAGIYFARAIVILLILALPLSPLVIIIFAAAMGFLWLSTVPLTSGIIVQLYGPRVVGLLFGLVFFSHQVGSFTGVWLGGALFDLTGDYTLSWQLSLVLSIIAGIMHLPIDGRRRLLPTGAR